MKILFIINPHAGSGRGGVLAKEISTYKEYQDVDYDIRFTEYGGHAREIVKEVRSLQIYSHIIAVGGDGTVNEIGSAMMGSDIKFGVISMGSGNGFARHLGYSQNLRMAVHQILTDDSFYADVVEINGMYSLNVSGVGFDAAVAHEFASMSGRGLLNYIRAGLKMWFQYKEREYIVKYDGKEEKHKCFILSIANTSQYGNNAKIAPNASIKDGLVNICILQRPHWYNMMFPLYLMTGKIEHLRRYHQIVCKEADIFGDIGKIHIDGEAVETTAPLHIKVHAGVLRVLKPK